MKEQNFDKVKKSILEYIQNLFEEMEQEMAMSHQEKYALLEDAFENAVDAGELKVAFDQWYGDHSEDLDWEYEGDELWEQAVAEIEE